MPIDPNEIGGWVSSCVNIDYLKGLRRHLDARLAALGAGPPPEDPKPLTDAVFQGGVVSDVKAQDAVAEIRPAEIRPVPAVVTGPAEAIILPPPSETLVTTDEAVIKPEPVGQDWDGTVKPVADLTPAADPPPEDPPLVPSRAEATEAEVKAAKEKRKRARSRRSELSPGAEIRPESPDGVPVAPEPEKPEEAVRPPE